MTWLLAGHGEIFHHDYHVPFVVAPQENFAYSNACRLRNNVEMQMIVTFARETASCVWVSEKCVGVGVDVCVRR